MQNFEFLLVFRAGFLPHGHHSSLLLWEGTLGITKTKTKNRTTNKSWEPKLKTIVRSGIHYLLLYIYNFDLCIMDLVKVQTGLQILCDYGAIDATNKTYFSAFCDIYFPGLWKAGAPHAEASLQENLIMTCNDKFALWNYLLPIWNSILLGDNSACARPAIKPRSWCTGSGVTRQQQQQRWWQRSSRVETVLKSFTVSCPLWWFLFKKKKKMLFQRNS